MVFRFILCVESASWRELGALGGLTTFRHYRSVDNFCGRAGTLGRLCLYDFAKC